MDEYTNLLKSLTNEEVEKETEKAINNLDAMKIALCYNELNTRGLDKVFLKLYNNYVKAKR